MPPALHPASVAVCGPAVTVGSACRPPAGLPQQGMAGGGECSARASEGSAPDPSRGGNEDSEVDTGLLAEDSAFPERSGSTAEG